ncbi:MAG: hypothetical protein ALECFALPRED_006892 [Alectoria fallacina]|uniref:Uncharacterized protein n=1 Tax=Alectoria fallacina TaxID=1903189 RepID=A0A8H3G679_9LECA|nr:MAG: hypothetical protein ALECFALPRED_006892 [Alectoria fallacina]
MSSIATTKLTNVLRSLTFATATPFTIYSIESRKPNGQVESLTQQEIFQPANMSSAPGHSTTTVYYNTIVAFLDLVDASGIPWTVLGGLLIAAGILGVQVLGSSLEWLYGRYISNGDSAEGNDE